MKKILSIITLTYNKLEEATKPFLKSLYECTDAEIFELIIVDNGSKDGTVEYLKIFQKSHDNVKIIFNSENFGYSQGCNQGAGIAEGKFVAFLNNDIILSNRWFDEILKIFDEENNAGLVSPFQIEGVEYSEKFFLKNMKKIQSIAVDNYKPAISPYFSCVVTKLKVFNEIGKFDESFTPAYFEDDDLSWRYIFAGYKNFISYKTFLFHKGSLTGKTLPNLNEIFEKNKKYFFQKYSDKYFIECTWELKNEFMKIAAKKRSKKERNIFYIIRRFLNLII